MLELLEAENDFYRSSYWVSWDPKIDKTKRPAVPLCLVTFVHVYLFVRRLHLARVLRCSDENLITEAGRQFAHKPIGQQYDSVVYVNCNCN